MYIDIPYAIVIFGILVNQVHWTSDLPNIQTSFLQVRDRKSKLKMKVEFQYKCFLTIFWPKVKTKLIQVHSNLGFLKFLKKTLTIALHSYALRWSGFYKIRRYHSLHNLKWKLIFDFFIQSLDLGNQEIILTSKWVKVNFTYICHLHMGECHPYVLDITYTWMITWVVCHVTNISDVGR